MVNITSLNNFAYANNDINVVFETGAAAVNGSIVINRTNGTPQQGATIGFFFEDEEVNFIYTYASFLDFYNDVSSNYILSSYFKATYNNNSFTLTAYAAENLGIEIKTSANFAPCMVTVTEGGAAEVRVLLGVDIWKGFIYKPTKFDKSHKADSFGLCSFNIAPAFDFEDFTFIGADFIGFHPRITKALKYRLRYAEQTATGTSQTYTASQLFALNGGFSSSYLGSAIDSNNYLTASPRYMISRDDEPRFLTVLATSNINNCEIRIIAYDFNNADHTIQKVLNAMEMGDLQLIPISYKALNLGTHASAPFYKYTLEFTAVTGSEGIGSEVFTIECDRAVHHNYSTFLFLNSRGGIDTISFVGATEAKTDFSKLQLQRTTGEGLHEKMSDQHRLEYSYKQYTGYYDDYDLYCYLEEFLQAKQVWWLQNGAPTQIEITPRELEKGDLKDTLWSAEFEFYLLNNDIAADLKFAAKVTAPTPTAPTVQHPPSVVHYIPTEIE
jgi:hypothetical protein